MANKVVFWCASEIVRKVRAEEGKGDPHAPFRGMHVIICGDFHQFPPVGNPTSALYCERPSDSSEAVLGRSIYQQFKTIIMLKKTTPSKRRSLVKYTGPFADWRMHRIRSTGNQKTDSGRPVKTRH